MQLKILPECNVRNNFEWINLKWSSMTTWLKGVFDSNEAYGLKVQNIQFKRIKKLFDIEHIWIVPGWQKNWFIDLIFFLDFFYLSLFINFYSTHHYTVDLIVWHYYQANILLNVFPVALCPLLRSAFQQLSPSVALKTLFLMTVKTAIRT